MVAASAKYIEYHESELLINCDGKNITNDEKISCNSKYYHNISKMDFKINADFLEITDFKQNENWKILSSNENNYPY